MAEVHVLQMPIFKKAYKKLHSKEKAIIDGVVQQIINNPKLGKSKKGDLNAVFVYKFKMNNQETLLAYESTSKQRILLAFGVRENFYRDLKKSL